MLNADGAGYESDIIAGLEAAVDPANPHRAQVVNMSLGGAGDGTDPLGQAATHAARQEVAAARPAAGGRRHRHRRGRPEEPQADVVRGERSMPIADTAPSTTGLAVSPDGGWLYAGTDQCGVHRLQLLDK